MLAESKYNPEDPALFKSKALKWAASFKTACYFDSNGYSDPYSAFDTLIAAGTSSEVQASSKNAFIALQNFLEKYNCWIPGFLSYDLKNEIEDLQSSNPDHLNFPDLHFFVPEHLILIKGGEVTLLSSSQDALQKINEQSISIPVNFNGEIKSRYSREEYLSTVQHLQEHIRRGDIYEVNFCQEFYAENVILDPVSAFSELNRISPTPFANFFRSGDHYIISATPERFLSKRGNKLISQPIKGTARRSNDPKEDTQIKRELRNNSKEQAENVMIVDLVRNDLSKCAVNGTVRVEELFGIYSFKQVHQMISTVVCDADPSLSNTELIQYTFPMGSMTGAPKIMAMHLIEQYERTKRGIFSGATGYFAPNGDFDFNVIIRSLLYNSATKYLSFQVGSAITFDSDPEKEYEECLLKAEAIREVLK
ncbi:MAG TPA: aminodeoxychorismate synthase component I [Sphingobacteriaceae bacterium]|nr:aminodeoxychorismate synthase component I [Sphingobacteriaceae bacterium]